MPGQLELAEKEPERVREQLKVPMKKRTRERAFFMVLRRKRKKALTKPRAEDIIASVPAGVLELVDRQA